jgi:hypothetical protein
MVKEKAQDEPVTRKSLPKDLIENIEMGEIVINIRLSMKKIVIVFSTVYLK